MKHRALWILGLGLTALACASGEAPRSKPPAPDDTTTEPPPTGTGGAPALPRDAAAGGSSATTPDAAPAREDADTPPAPGDAGPADGGPSAPDPTGPRGPFTCSLVVGIQATGDWFNGGFEKIVDSSRWELLEVHSAFINYWADPKNGVWGNQPTSRCAKNADNPDRVILVVLSLHWEIVPAEEWVKQITLAMNNFKAKYSNLRNLELSTFVRSPGDKPCPLGDTFRNYDLAPADEAFKRMAAMYPDLVTVAPIVHVDSCADYNNHPPHLTSGPASRAAMKMGAIYKD
ncbi:MAG TPA: hypothetical protein VN914_13020 [Polyangia bacterium]|nr:hypothetical protein [Polyangia bacterium]